VCNELNATKFKKKISLDMILIVFLYQECNLIFFLVGILGGWVGGFFEKFDYTTNPKLNIKSSSVCKGPLMHILRKLEGLEI
jgi:hypothetical protein